MIGPCSRCGLERGPDAAARCGAADMLPDLTEVLACRNRELANVWSLLRVATGQLERLRDQLDAVLESIS